MSVTGCPCCACNMTGQRKVLQWWACVGSTGSNRAAKLSQGAGMTRVAGKAVPAEGPSEAMQDGGA